LSSERSGLGSGGEVVTELLLETIGVGLEHLLVLDKGEGVGVGGIGLVEEEVEADGAEGEVSDGDLVSGNVAGVGVGGESLLDGGDPHGEVLQPSLLVLGPLFLVLLEVELEVDIEVVLNGVNGRVDLVGELGLLGVVAVLAAEESEDGPGLREVLAIGGLEHGNLAELELAGALKLRHGLAVDEHVLVGLLGVGQEEADGLSAAVDVEVVELHIFCYQQFIYL